MNNNFETIIKEVVKEALREVLSELNLNNNANEVVGVDVAKGKDVVVTTPSTKVKKEEIAKVVEKVKEEVVNEGSGTRKEDLLGMSFNDIKALAKELGLKAVGSKVMLVDKILEADGIDAEQVEEEIEEVTSSHEEIEETEEEEEEEDAEEEEPTLYDKVVKELEGTPDEELATILSDLGISPKGKRQALLTKIVQAIEDGKLEWEEEEEGEEEEEEEVKVEPKKSEKKKPAKKEKVIEPVVEETEEEEEEMTPERAEAVEELEGLIREEYKNEELSDKEILTLLTSFMKGEYKGANKKENLENYIAIKCELIDDDGEVHAFKDPYFIGERTLCCANDLKELENGNMYCEECGTEYDTEE